jgi:hypothetical protein
MSPLVTSCSSSTSDGTLLERSIDYELAGMREQIQLQLVRGPKALGLSMLEVADFVVHAAGTAARESLKGVEMLSRKDFSAVFGSYPEPISHFIRLDELTVRPQG